MNETEEREGGRKEERKRGMKEGRTEEYESRKETNEKTLA